MRFRRFIFSTRGLYLVLAQSVILYLKQRTGSGVSLPAYLLLLIVVITAQLYRTWAAGFVGTAARGRETHADVLLTNGPYAHVRNPMYLGNLFITSALAMMSGFWYAPPIAWASYAFVYGNVIPYEEAYLREQFGEAYQAYCRAVPRLLPTLRGYPHRQGVFQLWEGLSNELAAWAALPVFCYLFWRL